MQLNHCNHSHKILFTKKIFFFISTLQHLNFFYIFFIILFYNIKLYLRIMLCNLFFISIRLYISIMNFFFSISTFNSRSVESGALKLFFDLFFMNLS